MATISPQDVALNGVDPTFSTAEAGGDAFNNGAGSTILVRIINAAGLARTVTVNAANECSHGVTHDVVLVTADGDDITVGPFERARFNGAGGLVSITYSDEAGITLAILSVTEAGTGANEA